MQLAPIKSLKNEDFLRQKYLEEGLSLQEIAAETVSSWKTVRRHLLYMKIPLKSKDGLGQRTTKFGMQRVGGQLIQNQIEQEGIRQIISLKKQGHTFRYIVEFLNQNKIPCRNIGSKWHIKTVFKCFKDNVKLGDL